MYIDPGAGSLVVQILSAAIIGAAASFTRVRRWIVSIFSRRDES